MNSNKFHPKNIVSSGKALTESSHVLIMIHGRGASAEDILSLSQYLNVKDFSLLAPQAGNHSWYPYSFMAPVSQNEPWLSAAISLQKEILDDLLSKGIPTKHIYFLGFSQGACLALEFVARNAAQYGGVVAFTGGLIGERLDVNNYKGDFKNTPIFIGTSNPDPHVPVNRVNESTVLLQDLNAVVTEKIYNNMGHTINEDEISWANKLVFTEQ